MDSPRRLGLFFQHCFLLMKGSPTTSSLQVVSLHDDKAFATRVSGSWLPRNLLIVGMFSPLSAGASRDTQQRVSECTPAGNHRNSLYLVGGGLENKRPSPWKDSSTVS